MSKHLLPLPKLSIEGGSYTHQTIADVERTDIRLAAGA